MSLPRLSAEQSLVRPPRNYVASSSNPYSITHAVAPQADISCLSSCVGSSTAYHCLYCGSDLNCWQRCSGRNTACISGCFN
jgi:hypothetical protein